MQLQDLRHWHWAIIGLILGAMMGGIRAHFAETPEMSDYDRSFNERVLEDWLASKNPVNNQYPYFTSLTVRPYEDRQLVMATYMDQVSRARANPKDPNSKVVEKFIERTAFIVPETGVYVSGGERFAALVEKSVPVRVTLKEQAIKDGSDKLKTVGFKETGAPAPDVRLGTVDPRKLHQLMRLGVAESVAAVNDRDTIKGFLDKVKSKNPDLKVSYHWAWWAAPRAQFWLWAMGGVVVVGGFWPFVVNVLSFGRLVHPAREKPEVDLSKVKSAPVKKTSTAAVDNTGLDERIKDLEEDLEDFIKTSAAVQTQGPADSAPVIKTLSGGPLEQAAVDAKPPTSKEYGGEFYPTVGA